MSSSSLRLRTVLVGVTATALASAGVIATGVTPAAADTCSAPIGRDVLITQGLNSYSVLTQGKSAMVAFYLSQPNSPDCTGRTMQITSGTLRITKSDGTSGQVTSMITPAAGSSAVVPLYGTVQNNAPGNPTFVVDGSILKTGSGGSFTATFAGDLVYRVTDSTGATVSAGTLTVSTSTSSGQPITKTIAAKSKPLRILVVPMGDANASTPQWDSAANDAVVNGMVALDRLAPVGVGVSDLGGTGGVQFKVSTALLNVGQHVEYVNGLPQLKSYMTNGVFCGNGPEYTWIAGQLGTLLSNWNSTVGNPTADRALGVISERISIGPSTSTQSCPNGTLPAEGVAGVGGQFAWIRAVGPSTTAPGSPNTRQGTTGGVAGLELMHTYGGSIANSTTYHSSNTAADTAVADTGRAVNLGTHAFLSTNRALMNFQLSPWDEYSTLYERVDWDYLGCALRLPPGSKISSSCGGTVTSATNGMSAATGGLVLVGSTDGTLGGTEAYTMFASTTPTDGRDDSSSYRLVVYDSLNIKLSDTGVRVVTSESTHPTGTLDSASTAPLTFGVALPAAPRPDLVPAPGAASRFELQRVTSTGPVVLYARALNAPPTFVSSYERATYNGAVKHSSGSAPAVSWNGKYIARSVSGTIRISPATPGSTDYTATAPGQQAAFSRDGTQLAVINNGNASVYPVTYTAGVPALGPPRLIYSTSFPSVQPAASDPVFVSTGNDTNGTSQSGLVMVIQGKGIVEVDLTSGLLPFSSTSCALNAALPAGGVPPCSFLTTMANDSRPTLNQAGDWLAFQRGPDGGSQVQALLLASPNTQTTCATGAGSPAYTGSELIATTSAGLASYVATGGSCTDRQPVTSIATDSRPAGSQTASVVAFQRGSDVYLATAQQRTGKVVINGVAGQDYRLSVYRSYGGVVDPVVGNLRGTTSGTTTTFTYSYPADRVPDGAGSRFVVTDGFVTATKDVGPTAGSLAKASVSIYAPIGTILSRSTIPISGSATTPTGAPSNDITWTLFGPAGSPYANGVVVGTGGSLPDLDPGPAGWTPGNWQVRASFLDVQKVDAFTILADTDGDGIPDIFDNPGANPCYPADAATNPNNAQADPDGDLLPSIIDAQGPCRSSVNMTVSFTPTTSDGTSNGNVVKTRLSSTALDVRRAAVASTFITYIGGCPVRIQAQSIQVSSGTATVSFDRGSYVAAVQGCGLGLTTTPVVVQVLNTSPQGYGYDPNAPTNV